MTVNPLTGLGVELGTVGVNELDARAFVPVSGRWERLRDGERGKRV